MLTKVKKHNILALGILVWLILSITSAIYLRSNKTFEELSLYTSAVCKNDLHAFKSDTCEECGKNITDVGIFFNRELKDESEIDSKSDTKAFKDYFSSYDEYKSSTTSVSFFSILFLVSFIVLIIAVIADIKMQKYIKKGENP